MSKHENRSEIRCGQQDKIWVRFDFCDLSAKTIADAFAGICVSCPVRKICLSQREEHWKDLQSFRVKHRWQMLCLS